MSQVTKVKSPKSLQVVLKDTKNTKRCVKKDCINIIQNISDNLVSKTNNLGFSIIHNQNFKIATAKCNYIDDIYIESENKNLN